MGGYSQRAGGLSGTGLWEDYLGLILMGDNYLHACALDEWVKFRWAYHAFLRPTGHAKKLKAQGERPGGADLQS